MRTLGNRSCPTKRLTTMNRAHSTRAPASFIHSTAPTLLSTDSRPDLWFRRRRRRLLAVLARHELLLASPNFLSLTICIQQGYLCCAQTDRWRNETVRWFLHCHCCIIRSIIEFAEESSRMRTRMRSKEFTQLQLMSYLKLRGGSQRNEIATLSFNFFIA